MSALKSTGVEKDVDFDSKLNEFVATEDDGLEEFIISHCKSQVDQLNHLKLLRKLAYVGSSKSQNVFVRALTNFVLNGQSNSLNVENAAILFSSRYDYLGLEILSRVVWISNQEYIENHSELDQTLHPAKYLLGLIVANFRGKHI